MTKEEIRKKSANEYYSEILHLLKEKEFKFLIGGAFALHHNTGIYRDTKDIDLFCSAGEYPKILRYLNELGFQTEITDARWLAKAFKDEHLIDFIFNSPNSLCAVDDSWFEFAEIDKLYGVDVKFLAPEELFWCKIYVQNRERYDGADVNHIILKRGKTMNWHRVLQRMDQHWQLMLAAFLNFQFVYPSERDCIPKWVFEELMQRAKDQFDLPVSKEPICRGMLLEHTHYNTDILEWGYKIMTCKRL